MSRLAGMRVVRALPWALPAVFIAVFPLLSDALFFQSMIILSLVYAIGAVGLNIIAGYGGYISLGQSAFIGVGAYTVAVLAVRTHESPFVWVPVAGLVAAAFAAVLGVVALRTRGFSFVIITIAFLFLMQLVTINWDSLTRGASGITLPIPTWSVQYQYWPFYYPLLALLVASLLLSWWIRRTKFGMGLMAMREDEDKAATVGISTPVYKLLGFVASAGFVGMAGGIYGYYLSFVSPLGMFDIVISVLIILAMLLGGRGTLFGPVLGAFIVEPLNEIANQQLGGGNARLLIFGGLMALTVLLLPKGIIPSLRERLAALRRRGRPAPAGARLITDAAAAGVGTSATPAPASPSPAVPTPAVPTPATPPPGAPAKTTPPAARAPAAPAPAASPVTVQSPAGSARNLLEVKGLKKRFGGLRAVDECSFAVPEGSITALIGPNGSGKTTTFNLITGTMSPDAGEIWFDGRRIEKLHPWQRAHLGLGRTFQITRLFREMTVLENVVAPLQRFSFNQLGAVAVSGAERARAEDLLEFVHMRQYRDERADALSYGQQKLVELAQVLMLDPKLVLLDEPAGGINPTLIERIADMIRELNRRGKTFLIVEHNLPLVTQLCDPVLVLARGSCLAQGTPEQIHKDPRVLDAYLGEDFEVERGVRG